ncbi:unnamed protein product [Phytophthora lilii]|uniref:Unnamed protein product n=1 Tax=Phytophthora lilii TaxID=2077276 RepID=A0A9W6WRH5_9STRA|nr:unnamed protein product [Phytophthora lilii]
MDEQAMQWQQPCSSNNQRQSRQQQQPSESSALDTREYRAEGITMLKFSGTKEDDVGDYMFSAKLYFESKNIQYGSEAPQQRPLSLLVANLKGPAAAWYREYVSHDGHFLRSVTQFEELLSSEFTAPDRQEHLRDQLLRLRQRNFSCLEDYVAAFRGIICKVEDMSDIDKVMHFQKGLLTDIKQEVKLRQFRTTTDAIAFALMYDRTHFVSSRQPGLDGRAAASRRTVARIPRCDSAWTSSQRPWRSVTHVSSRVKSACGRSSFRANQSSFRRVVDDEDDSDDGDVDFVDGSDDHVEVIDSLQLNMVAVDGGASSKRELLRFEGRMNGQAVLTAERFDGTTTPARTAQRCCETLSFDGRDFSDVSLIEWDVSANQDVILGHPWLVQFNPVINWQTGVMRFPRPRLVQDVRSTNDSLDVAPPTVAAVKVKAEFLQHPLPSNLRQQLDDHVNAGYFHMPLGPSAMAAFGCLPSPDEIDTGISLCVLSTAQFATKVKAEEYVELYHVNVKASPKQPSTLCLSKVEQEALDIFVAELLKKNWIELSDSPWVSNIFGVPKKDPVTGKFPSRLEWLHSNNPHMPIRWIIDYRLVNAASEVAKIPLPHIEQLFDRMVGAVLFTILDLASGYHQMRMAPTSKQYTAFRTNQEIYHWNVAHMGLAGMPGTWTRLMRKVLSHFTFVVVYLDDICIFSRSMADHVEHLWQVCEVLRLHKLYARPDKCDFGQRSVDFLGHTISVDGLHVDARKTRAIAEWMEPSNIKDLQRFLGLAGYYRRFIHRFATLVLPLSGLVKKDVPWVWDDLQRQAFNAIKLALQHAPVLQLPDFDKPFIVTTDASHACIGGVLSQLHDGSDLPVAFFSKKLGPHELNWPVHEKELFAIKQALTRWRHYLHGVSFEVYTDNSACKWFMQHPRLSGRLARWLDFFASFQFTLHHRPGALNVVTDALSRPPGSSSSPGEGQDDSESKTMTVSLCAACLSSQTCTDIRVASRRDKTTEKLRSIPTRDQDVMLAVKQPASGSHSVGTAQLCMRVHAASTANSTVISSLQLDTRTKRAFQKAYGQDPDFMHLWKSGRTSEDYEVVHGLVYLKSGDSLRRLCVPNNRKLWLDVIHNAHDAAIMAHPGIRRTQLAAAQWYFWPNMDLDIKAYVQSCESCMRYKSSTGRKTGKLQPVPVPAACWEVTSTDFITHLPVSDGFDAIMVVVDKLSKRPVYIPTHTTATAEDTAKLFFNNVIRHYGIPSTIISDRDQKFTSKFWTALVSLTKIKAAMTTAHRAQADGQTKRQNRTLDDSLRCSISYHGTDWNEHLPMIEYAHATLVSSSSKLSPFFVDTGREPKNPLVIERARKNLLDTQAAQKKFYDKRRAENPFKVGDLALLSTQDLNISHSTAETTLRSRKFIPRFIGPYSILEIQGNVALLDLPANLKHLSPRFNIDKLKVYISNPDRFEGRVILKSTPVIFDDDGEPLHVIEALIKRRTFNRQPEYLVKWHGLPHHENTWERARDIKHVSHWQALLKDLRRRSQVRA